MVFQVPCVANGPNIGKSLRMRRKIASLDDADSGDDAAMTDIPKWLLKQEGITAREWKIRKRRELKRLIFALGIYQIGAAYAPRPDLERRIKDDLNALQCALSVKNWGR